MIKHEQKSKKRRCFIPTCLICWLVSVVSWLKKKKAVCILPSQLWTYRRWKCTTFVTRRAGIRLWMSSCNVCGASAYMRHLLIIISCRQPSTWQRFLAQVEETGSRTAMQQQTSEQLYLIWLQLRYQLLVFTSDLIIVLQCWGIHVPPLRI